MENYPGGINSWPYGDRSRLLHLPRVPRSRLGLYFLSYLDRNDPTNLKFYRSRRFCKVLRRR